MRVRLTFAGIAIATAVACKAPSAPIVPDDAAVPIAAAATSAPAQSVSASAAAPSSVPAAEVADVEASAPPAAPLPAVKVENIGMHIGGGPNDAPTKEPIGKSVEPHFDELRACFAKVTDQKHGGDFGVDLKIPANGGKAQVSSPRTAIKGPGFQECVMGVFQSIDFLKPRFGLTVVSYSLRFTPQ
jgi:hypothetical protein